MKPYRVTYTKFKMVVLNFDYLLTMGLLLVFLPCLVHLNLYLEGIT
jgi:hypothetical protein